VALAAFDYCPVFTAHPENSRWGPMATQHRRRRSWRLQAALVRRSTGYSAIEVKWGARLALAAYHDDEEALDYGGEATGMAANGKAARWRSVAVEEEDNGLRSTLRESRSTSELGEGTGTKRTRWYLQLGRRRCTSSGGERRSEDSGFGKAGEKENAMAAAMAL
jgi:hypothetical protein